MIKTRKYALLIIMIVLSPIIVSAQTYNVASKAEFDAAVTEINTNGGDNIISIESDITNAGGFDFTNNNGTTTIIGNNHTLTGLSTIYVSNGAKLILGDGETSLTISGITNNDDPGMIYALQQSTVTMNNLVTLKDHQGNNYIGGGVSVENATFIMNGGTITNCGIQDGSVNYGGGVGVYAGGKFIMNGGEISNNYALTSAYYNSSKGTYSGMGGGVYVTSGSYFQMNGGTIKDNESTLFGGGVALVEDYNEMSYTGKKGMPLSKVEINGGTISGNESSYGGGVGATGMFTSEAFAIGTYSPGIGVQAENGLVINGGKITGNIAGEGGGIVLIALRESVHADIKNVEISNNEADDGGGILVYSYWTQAKIDNATIKGNFAEIGGGIALISNESRKTKVIDSTIIDNVSTSIGAGIYYDYKSMIELSGKNTIQNNKNNGILNNVNVLSRNNQLYPIYIGGDLTGSKIGLTDPKLLNDGLADDDETAQSENYLTSGYNATNPEKPDNNPLQYFTSDHNTWIADYGLNAYDGEVRLVRVKYTLHYNDGETENSVAYYDPSNPADLPTLSDRGNYKFSGWYKNSELTGEIYTKTPTTNEGDVDYYAKWEELTTYSITYETNDGDNSPDNPDSYTSSSNDIVLKDPTKKGYNFLGWYLDEEFNNQITEIPTGSTGNLKLYAKWETIKYPINYVLDGGTNNSDNPSKYTIEDEVNIKDPTKKGYKFIKWEEGNKIEKGSDGEKTFTASWETIKYPINYVLDGGTNNSDNPSEYTIENEVNIKDPTKEGYKFIKWEEGNKIEKGSDGEKTFTAKWEKNEEEIIDDETEDNPDNVTTSDNLNIYFYLLFSSVLVFMLSIKYIRKLNK